MRGYLIYGKDNARLDTVLMGSAWKIYKEIYSPARVLTQLDVERALGEAAMPSYVNRVLTELGFGDAMDWDLLVEHKRESK